MGHGSYPTLRRLGLSGDPESLCVVSLISTTNFAVHEYGSVVAVVSQKPVFSANILSLI